MAILVRLSPLPRLMLGYEKCITFPEVAVDNLMAFGGFGASPACVSVCST